MQINWQKIRNTASLVSNIFLPATILCIALFSFYLCTHINFTALYIIHGLFYFFGLATIAVLFKFKTDRTLFFALNIILSYAVLNFLKSRMGTDFASSNIYQNLKILLPLNLAIFYFWPNQKFIRPFNAYLLFFTFLEYALAEKLHFMHYPNIGMILFCLLLLAAFIHLAFYAGILNYGLFFCTSAIALAFYYNEAYAALNIFYCAAIFILLTCLCLHIYYKHYHNLLTGLPNQNYFWEDIPKFKLKYSLIVTSLDDYKTFQNKFGIINRHRLIKMVANIVAENSADFDIYHYNDTDFVLVLKRQNLKEAFAAAELIRRNIAAADFMLPHYKLPIKLTVSCTVAEKRRSDANHNVVLQRAFDTLKKTKQFTLNVTSKAAA